MDNNQQVIEKYGPRIGEAEKAVNQVLRDLADHEIYPFIEVLQDERLGTDAHQLSISFAKPPARPGGIPLMVAHVVKSEGAQLITLERARQIDGEGWSDGHDDEHINRSLLFAAIAYMQTAIDPMRSTDEIRHFYWPWDAKWWKPSHDLIRNLVKAGALIAAEIDRRKRAQVRGEQKWIENNSQKGDTE